LSRFGGQGTQILLICFNNLELRLSLYISKAVHYGRSLVTRHVNKRSELCGTSGLSNLAGACNRKRVAGAAHAHITAGDQLGYLKGSDALVIPVNLPFVVFCSQDCILVHNGRTVVCQHGGLLGAHV